jgi:ABC-2 type transport system ATP-binding protein
MANALVFEDVVKIFGGKKEEKVTAVDHLNLTVRKGEIFSLVGPDGAGKTTSIRIMCGILPPNGGRVTVLDYDIKKDRNEIKKHIGYLSQRFSLYHDLSIDENIDFFAEIHRIRGHGARKEELLQFTRLAAFRNRLAGQLSGGMKQKLALACTLIHTPDIIFLDEPTTGVDPVSRREFWKILSSLLKSGITIIISTPYLDEAERSTRVALINRGLLLKCDTPEKVKSSFEYEVAEVVCDDIRRASEVLARYYGRNSLQTFGDRLHIMAKDAKKYESDIKQKLKKENIGIRSLRFVPPSLEDVFIASMTP